MDTLRFAKSLRHNQTETEYTYVVDFVNMENKLIIELDGGQHNDLESKNYDNKRTKFLENSGFKVIRFWDDEVFTNLVGVLETILSNLGTSP